MDRTGEAFAILVDENTHLREVIDALRAELATAESFHRVAVNERNAERNAAKRLREALKNTQENTAQIREAAALLGCYRVWFKAGKLGLYHAIEGDHPTEDQWAEIGKALEALAGAANGGE
jgi:cell division septum initiation protein DivIVA